MITVVTGVGAKGQVGEAVAAALAARGDHVAIVSREAREVEDRASELRSRGHAVASYACDLSDPAAVSALAESVRRDLGNRIDALVNLAGGFGVAGPVAESDPASFQRMVQINLTTAYLSTRAFLPALRIAGGGIVFFASEAVLDGIPSRGIAGYAAAKSGVVALMRSVADEGRDYRVRANALAPAAIRTASNEAAMGSGAAYLERDEVASAVAFLCSPAAGFITGQVIRLQARPKARSPSP